MEAMTRRRLICGLLLASVVLACFAGVLWIANAFRVRAMEEQAKKRYEQVRERLTLQQIEGMTKEEVVRTLGSPEEDAEDFYVYPLYDSGRTLLIFFDKGGKVDDVDRSGCGPLRPPTPTLTGRIRRWLGL
jgi:hypothetical protein